MCQPLLAYAFDLYNLIHYSFADGKQKLFDDCRHLPLRIKITDTSVFSLETGNLCLIELSICLSIHINEQLSLSCIDCRLSFDTFHSKSHIFSIC